MRFTASSTSILWIDLHTNKMYIVSRCRRQDPVHQNIKTNPEAFLSIITPFLEDVVVAASACSPGTGSLTSVSREHPLRPR